MNQKDSLSDERLAVLHQRKRLNAFFTIYHRYQNYGYAIVYSTLKKFNLMNALKDEKDAILYDSIMEALNIFDGKRGTFRKLLSAIIANQTANYIYNFKSDPLSDYISIDGSFNEGATLRFADSLTIADKSETPQDRINVNEDLKKVALNYNGLYKRRIKRMVKLREAGYTYKEIAKKLGTTERSVRSIFYRIKRKLDLKESNKVIK